MTMRVHEVNSAGEARQVTIRVSESEPLVEAPVHWPPCTCPQHPEGVFL